MKNITTRAKEKALLGRIFRLLAVPVFLMVLFILACIKSTTVFWLILSNTALQYSIPQDVIEEHRKILMQQTGLLCMFGFVIGLLFGQICDGIRELRDLVRSTEPGQEETRLDESNRGH